MIDRSSDGLETTDYELIKECLSGNRDIFAKIVARYKRLIYNTIHNFIGNSQDTNDLFQEVFLKIYRSLADYSPDYRFSTWAVRITTNLCLDRLRQKRPEQIILDDIAEARDNRLNPEECYLAQEQQEKIRKAIEALPEEYRVPVILFHQQEFSYEEMSEILGQPMTIIKNRLYRARLMLRDSLISIGGKESASYDM